ncbi:MAG: hypothetical protein NTX64_17225 [Elusimicrobia bacterium]|nr:hypothetical protein [Elusimicrobiota bacterium]
MKNRSLLSLLVLTLALPALASPAPAPTAAPKKKAAVSRKATAQDKSVSVPFSVFQSTADLKVGGSAKWTAADGVHYGGTIKSIRKGLVTVRLEPQKYIRRELPFTVFNSTAGAKPGMPVGFNVDGKMVNGTVIAVGTNTITVELFVP